jgi:formamidopyrimidine-DNA glycosylase
VARRHPGGGADLCARLVGRTCASVERRGKYLWVTLRNPGATSADERDVLIAHLGMSGQFRLSDGPLNDHPHLRFDARLDDGSWLSFLDQRTFGGLALDQLGPDASGQRLVPSSLTHIGADPFEATFDTAEVAAVIRRRHSEIKRVLLDQSVVSGIGNIYADEALWRAQIHPTRSAHRLTSRAITTVVEAATEVMAEALAQGGTSFDALYVNVNGESGYFERSLAVYGRQDEACRRCGAPIRRLHFQNRSSFVCQRCQRPPRLGSAQLL